MLFREPKLLCGYIHQLIAFGLTKKQIHAHRNTKREEKSFHLPPHTPEFLSRDLQEMDFHPNMGFVYFHIK